VHRQWEGTAPVKMLLPDPGRGKDHIAIGNYLEVKDLQKDIPYCEVIPGPYLVRGD